MDETRQEKRVIGLNAHPYMFSAAALSGSHALHAQVEWSVDRISLNSLERILKKRANPGDIVASDNTFALAERLLRIGLHPIVSV
jgi:hypothetical protein